jgi:Tol biopolymer transport system component/uncharacterized protein YraI
MQNNFWSFPTTAIVVPRVTRLLSLGLTLALSLWLGWPATLSAQSTAPTPMPLAPANSLIAVAGGHGAELWNAANGALVAQVEPGTRLVASKRSVDGQWLYVTTDNGSSGWAAATALIVFYRLELLTEAVTITPTTPTPAAAPLVEDSASITATTAETATTTTMAAADNAAAPNAADEEATVATVRSSTRLNIRSGPGTSYAVVGKAEPGQQLTLIGTAAQGWVEVQLPNTPEQTGWVAEQYLSTSATAASAVVNTTSPPAVQTSSGAAPASGLSGKLVFQTSFGGPIYLYELASGNLRQLTSGFDPALSPDGRQVVFTRGGGDNGIYVINSDGSGERKIFGERELLLSPKWSPDGKWIVFMRGDEFEPCFFYEDNGRCYREPLFPGGNAFDNPSGKNPVTKLARIDSNGGNYRDIATLEQAMAPDWNSGGIVYQSAGGLQITADQAGDPNRKLFFQIQRQYHQDPDWQPGGGRVVFQQKQGSHWEIFGINSDGGGLAALTRPATALVDTMPSNVAPAWSPNGQFIVFLSNRMDNNEAGPWRLWVMNSDGSNQRPLPVNLTFNYGYTNEQIVDWGP